MSPTPSHANAAVVTTMLVLLAAAAGYGLATWRQARHPAAATVAGATAPASASTAASTERQVLYWYDPMKPDARFDKPGRSPFMDMDLVPRYADEAGSGGVRVSAALSQSLGLRLAKVAQENLASRIDAVGTLAFNDREVAIVQTRSAGFVEKVYARAPGDVVAAGAPLADLLVPEWAGAQQEYLAVRATGEAALTGAARQRLLLLGMDEASVRELERTGQPRRLVTLASPIAGVIQELMVRQGMAMAPMMTAARINGLASLWLDVAVPEVHAALLAPGRPVQARFAAWPGETFEGRIAAVLPEAQKETRSLRVRIELPNRSGKLRAGLYAQVTLRGPAEPVLVVPSEAVIRTGQRAVVFLAGAEPGQFAPVEVRLGREVGDKLVVLQGLQAGQQVVASGQFLVDSEANLAGVVARTAAAPAVHEVTGVVEGIEGLEITLQHDPVPALKWPAMSMPFALKSALQAAGLKVGDPVVFSFSEGASGVVVEKIARRARQTEQAR